MKQVLRLILIALTLLLVGARDLPRPCLGDGLGNPCAPARCQCTVLCSCRSACGAGASGDTTPVPACHMHTAADPAAEVTHFSLPEPKPPVLLPQTFRFTPLPREARDLSAFTPVPYPSPSLLPPEPPPRLRV